MSPSPQDIEDRILQRAQDLFTLTCMEGGIDFPEDVARALLPSVMRTAIQAATEYYRSHASELLAQGQNRCTVCSLPVGDYTLMVPEARLPYDLPSLPSRVARPCGHVQHV